jgi:hypothetical protein
MSARALNRMMFADESLEQLKAAIRMKLGIDKKASVKLEWLRDGRELTLSDGAYVVVFLCALCSDDCMNTIK